MSELIEVAGGIIDPAELVRIQSEQQGPGPPYEFMIVGWLRGQSQPVRLTEVSGFEHEEEALAEMKRMTNEARAGAPGPADSVLLERSWFRRDLIVSIEPDVEQDVYGYDTWAQQHAVENGEPWPPPFSKVCSVYGIVTVRTVGQDVQVWATGDYGQKPQWAKLPFSFDHRDNALAVARVEAETKAGELAAMVWR